MSGRAFSMPIPVGFESLVPVAALEGRLGAIAVAYVVRLWQHRFRTGQFVRSADADVALEQLVAHRSRKGALVQHLVECGLVDRVDGGLRIRAPDELGDVQWMGMRGGEADGPTDEQGAETRPAVEDKKERRLAKDRERKAKRYAEKRTKVAENPAETPAEKAETGAESAENSPQPEAENAEKGPVSGPLTPISARAPHATGPEPVTGSVTAKNEEPPAGDASGAENSPPQTPAKPSRKRTPSAGEVERERYRDLYRELWNDPGAEFTTGGFATWARLMKKVPCDELCRRLRALHADQRTPRDLTLTATIAEAWVDKGRTLLLQGSLPTRGSRPASLEETFAPFRTQPQTDPDPWSQHADRP